MGGGQENSKGRFEGENLFSDTFLFPYQSQVNSRARVRALGVICVPALSDWKFRRS